MCLLSSVRTPDLGYDFDSNSGRAFNYFSYGVACSEVEVDCLTGAHKVDPLQRKHSAGTKLKPKIFFVIFFRVHSDHVIVVVH